MNIQNIEKIAHANMAHRRTESRAPGWILYHGQRTGKIAVTLARKLNINVDIDVLYIAGLFHDVGKGGEPHHIIGADLTEKLLKKAVTKSALKNICDAVRNHNQRDSSENFPDFVKLVQDADLIDHVGLIDVWMSFYLSGHRGDSFHDYIEYLNGDERKGSFEFIKTHLNYVLSRRIFEERENMGDDLLSRFQDIYVNGI